MEKVKLDELDKLRRNPFYLLLLPLALMFISFTELRFSQSVGPGEILLAAWIGITLVVCARFSAPFSSFTKQTTIIMLITLADGVIGSAWAYVVVYSKRGLPASFINEMIGTLLNALICISFVFIANREFVEKCMKTFCLMSTVVYLYNYLFVSHGPRITIWSRNPNQTALYCYILAALSCILFVYGKNGSRFLYLLCCSTQVVIGLATASDGLNMSFLALPVLLVVLLFSFNLNKAIVWIFLAVTLVVILMLSNELMSFVLSTQEELTYGNQDQVRYTLWRVSLEAYLYSPVFGNGFGPHAGYMFPFSSEDAHNFILDYLVRYGAIGLGILLGWMGLIVKKMFRYKKFVMIAALFAFMPLALTHATYRMPVFFVFFLALFFLSEPRETMPAVLGEKAVYPVLFQKETNKSV